MTNPATETIEELDFYQEPEDVKYILIVEVAGEEVYNRTTAYPETIRRYIDEASEVATNTINEEATPWT